MTYVEFVENNSIENICACLSNPPERVIMVGEGFKKIEKKILIYKRLMRGRGYDTEFVPCPVNRNDLGSIVEKLCSIVEKYGAEELAFGVTGGEELFLVAMGIVFERYKEKNIQIHRFNIRNGSVIDCDGDGNTIMKDIPALSVEENIQIFGGEIIYEDVRPACGTVKWDMSEDFIRDIDSMWNVCRANTKNWNKQSDAFAEAEKYRDPRKPSLVTEVDMESLRRDSIHFDLIIDRSLLQRLYDAGLITDFYSDRKKARVEYKNEQVKRCLIKAGLVLEMKIYSASLLLKDKNGEPFYNDVMNGVCIDWDGKVQEYYFEGDTSNEIDVMMMRGSVPIFVSCKNGQVDKAELYKLNTVAAKFGGTYAKKILIANALDKESDYGKSLIRRATDMKIHVETKMDTMSEDQFIKELLNFPNLSL